MIKSCPCHYLEEPCHERCTCLNPFSSVGCGYCCSYGSEEQRRRNAKRMKKSLDKNE